MKRPILLLLCSIVFMCNLVAQVTEITGTTKSKTQVYFGAGNTSIKKIPEGQTVIIIDADDTYLTINYNGVKAYVLKRNVQVNDSDLKKLMESKVQKPLIAKPVQNLERNSPNQVIEDKYKYELDHIRYCAGRYRNQIMTGYTFSVIGAVITAGGVYSDKPGVPVAIGSAVGLIGNIIIIDSYKWMRRMSIGPDGIGIKYTF